ncbi:ABC transporter permease [Paenarthrobacter aromaticivorans]|uniref:ABC transporter permease n=1 Tax=Paenarthrobacter aromaticivorans TaxID=2849150 RepID=UPI003A80E4CC
MTVLSATDARVAVKARTRSVDGWLLAGIPGVVFLLVFFAWPLAQVLVRSLVDPSPQNYVTFLQTPAYMQILLQTFQIAAVVTLVCLLLGYPYAYLLSKTSGLSRTILLAVVLLPIWTSFLVRSVALQTWLQDTGVINSLLMNAGIISEPLPLIRTSLGVTVGMTQILLPFMILPLFSVMQRVRPDLLKAAASLGAPPRRAFFTVYLPQTLPGIISGSLLVFVISLGFFVVPAILGGTEGSMLSKLIVDMVGRSEFGMASTLAAILLFATAVILAIGSRFTNIRDLVGGGK